MLWLWQICMYRPTDKLYPVRHVQDMDFKGNIVIGQITSSTVEAYTDSPEEDKFV